MKKISILEGEKGQGKSSLLRELFGETPGVEGIITLRQEGNLRDFYVLPTGESWPMQGEAGYPGPWLEVGRFRFSEAAFRRASAYLLEAGRSSDARLLVMDEIGPLELRGEGFAAVLKELVELPDGPHLLLVVRSELLEEVRAQFGLKNALVESYDSMLFGLSGMKPKSGDS